MRMVRTVDFIIFVISMTLMARPSTTTDEIERKKLRTAIFNQSKDISALRFSKIEFSDPLSADLLQLPMTKKDYPISNQVASTMKLSNCPSVTTADDAEIKYSIPVLIRTIGGLPSHPSQDKNDPFWKQLREVIQLQRRRKYRGTSKAKFVMPLPNAWKMYTIDQVADAVHNEYPGYHQSVLIQRLMNDGAEIDNNIIPKRSNSQFLHGIVMVADLNTWAVSIVGPYAFACKYYAGRCRPEEVVWAIHQDRITEDDGLPGDIKRMVKSLGLTREHNFTAYPEGCPMHPSWPAMHSAASSASLWLAVVLNLTEEQRCQAKLTDYAVAYGRTVAGVHYPDDNIAGLMIGMEIVARELPEYLAKRYGSDPYKVRKKIKQMRFNWKNDFDPVHGC